MALKDRFDLAEDALFIQRVQQALTEKALAVAAEATVGLRSDRKALALRVLANPRDDAQNFARLVAQDATIAAAAGSPPNQTLVTDLQITGVVDTRWDAYARVFN